MSPSCHFNCLPTKATVSVVLTAELILSGIMKTHLFLGLLALVLTAAQIPQAPSLVESMLHLIMVDGARSVTLEPRDQRTLYKEYDFVIVGAGSAGCVLANRLSENPQWKVLLIEAGREENFLMDIPILANFLQFSMANWGYLTQPSNTSCLGMDKGQCHWPRGKVMGGSSVLNYMIYNRGNRRDYDRWAADGNKGWSWSDVLPYFKKTETFVVPEYMTDTTMHGQDGYMTVSSVPYRTKIADAFIDAGKYTGQPVVDYNGHTQTGFSYIQVTMKNGTRDSSSRAYLHTIRRPNLHVKKYSQVTKILIDPVTKTAYGVEFMRSRRSYTVRAKKEVILSAGTINSAQLLMLSGIGPRQHLQDKGIPVIQDLQVGYNLQDHIAPGGLTYTIKYPYSINTDRILKSRETLAEYFSFHRGPMSIPGGCEALAFYDLQNPNSTDGHPDLELLLISGGLSVEPTLKKDFNLDENMYRKVYAKLGNTDQIMVFPMVMRPKSVGRVQLADKNPLSKPLLTTGYYTDPERNDIKVAIAGIRKSNELLKTPPFKKMGARLHTTPLPKCKKYPFDSDKYWECFARHITFTIYHQVGTAKMGPKSDPTAVVDPRLRVYGIQRLRVVDASIMPVIPAAHTNAPTLMIAEKAADLIKEDWKYPIQKI